MNTIIKHFKKNSVLLLRSLLIKQYIKKFENKYINTRYITNDLSFIGAMTKCSITENNYQCQKEIQYQLDV